MSLFSGSSANELQEEIVNFFAINNSTVNIFQSGQSNGDYFDMQGRGDLVQRARGEQTARRDVPSPFNGVTQAPSTLSQLRRQIEPQRAPASVQRVDEWVSNWIGYNQRFHSGTPSHRTLDNRSSNSGSLNEFSNHVNCSSSRAHLNYPNVPQERQSHTSVNIPSSVSIGSHNSLASGSDFGSYHSSIGRSTSSNTRLTPMNQQLCTARGSNVNLTARPPNINSCQISGDFPGPDYNRRTHGCPDCLLVTGNSEVAPDVSTSGSSDVEVLSYVAADGLYSPASTIVIGSSGSSAGFSSPFVSVANGYNGSSVPRSSRRNPISSNFLDDETLETASSTRSVTLSSLSSDRLQTPPTRFAGQSGNGTPNWSC